MSEGQAAPGFFAAQRRTQAVEGVLATVRGDRCQGSGQCSDCRRRAAVHALERGAPDPEALRWIAARWGELLRGPDGALQVSLGVLACDEYGEEVEPEDETAVQWCLGGGVTRVGNEHFGMLIDDYGLIDLEDAIENADLDAHLEPEWVEGLAASAFALRRLYDAVQAAGGAERLDRCRSAAAVKAMIDEALAYADAAAGSV